MKTKCCLVALSLVLLASASSAMAQSPATSAPTGGSNEKRVRQRNSYRPLALGDATAPRAEIPLDGDWLFIPSHEAPAASGAKPDLPDDQWHVLKVPQFWNEIEWWIYY